MRPITDFVDMDVRSCRLIFDAPGAIAEGHFADQLEATRWLGEMLRDAMDPRYTITAKGREMLEGK